MQIHKSTQISCALEVFLEAFKYFEELREPLRALEILQQEKMIFLQSKCLFMKRTEASGKLIYELLKESSCENSRED